MSVFSGPQGPGAMARHRAAKRAAAEERQRLYATEVRNQARSYRLAPQVARNVVKVLHRARHIASLIAPRPTRVSRRVW